jgi:hypothetical protein
VFEKASHIINQNINILIVEKQAPIEEIIFQKENPSG